MCPKAVSVTSGPKVGTDALADALAVTGAQLHAVPSEVLKAATSVVPLKRVATTDEIFCGVRFIIECGYFTGRCIDIDGGFIP